MSIYLNNAATTWPKPASVAAAVCEFITERGANAARGAASRRDIESLDEIYCCRKKLAQLFGGWEKQNAKYVTLTANVTESLNIVIKGFLKDGMRVVTSSMEHNAVMRPLRAVEADGVKVGVVQCSLKGYLAPRSLASELDQGADLAIISHCSNVSGSLQNLEAIAEVCREKRVPLVVDCAQTGGVVPIDAEGLGLAALCFTGHKGLFGPQGTGGIVWQPEFAEKCSSFIEGGTGSLSQDEHQPRMMPDKFEAGTPNLPGLAGLLASLTWLEKTGLHEIRDREDYLGIRLEAGLRKIKGLRILGPAAGDPRLSVFGVNIDGKDNAELARDLVDRYGIETRPGLHCAPSAHKTLGSFPAGALRLSPGWFNTEEEIDAAIAALTELAK